MAAAGLNKAMLIGHVSCAPKINVTKGKVGVRQAIFILATTEEWFDKATNQRRTKTITHRIVVYGARERCRTLRAPGCPRLCRGQDRNASMDGKRRANRVVDGRDYRASPERPAHRFGLR